MHLICWMPFKSQQTLKRCLSFVENCMELEICSQLLALRNRSFCTVLPVERYYYCLPIAHLLVGVEIPKPRPCRSTCIAYNYSTRRVFVVLIQTLAVRANRNADLHWEKTPLLKIKTAASNWIVGYVKNDNNCSPQSCTWWLQKPERQNNRLL